METSTVIALIVGIFVVLGLLFGGIKLFGILALKAVEERCRLLESRCAELSTLAGGASERAGLTEERLISGMQRVSADVTKQIAEVSERYADFRQTYERELGKLRAEIAEGYISRAALEHELKLCRELHKDQ